MSNPLLIGAAACVAVTAALATRPAPATRVEVRVSLPHAARRTTDVPSCASDLEGLIAHDVVLKAGAAAVDASVGVALSPRDSPPANWGWLHDRVNVAVQGPAGCALLCVTYPRGVATSVEACLSEADGAGRDCTTAPADFPSGAARVESLTSAITDRAVVTCALAKNWSLDTTRGFSLEAAYRR